MFRHIVCLLAIAVPFQLLSVGGALAAKSDPTQMSCEEFLSTSESEQPAAAAFVEGWRNGKRQVELDEVGIERDLTTLVVSCEENPKESLLRRFEMHVPVVKRHVKPIAMACEDFVGLESDVGPELYYYLDGYDRASRTESDVAGEVDLEQDYEAFVEVCRQAPKQSVWEKIKTRLQDKP